MLAAVEKARQAEHDEPPQAGPAGGRPAQAAEQPLIDKLSELKMLRTLQVRVNTRTRRFSRLLDDAAERAEEPELRAVLARLAERQRAIEKAARDIVAGLTE
jgi:two-component sensor histidine kinase